MGKCCAWCCSWANSDPEPDRAVRGRGSLIRCELYRQPFLARSMGDRGGVIGCPHAVAVWAGSLPGPVVIANVLLGRWHRRAARPHMLQELNCQQLLVCQYRGQVPCEVPRLVCEDGFPLGIEKVSSFVPVSDHGFARFDQTIPGGISDSAS